MSRKRMLYPELSPYISLFPNGDNHNHSKIVLNGLLATEEGNVSLEAPPISMQIDGLAGRSGQPMCCKRLLHQY